MITSKQELSITSKAYIGEEDLTFNVQTLLNGTASSNDLNTVSSHTVTIKAGNTHGTFSVQTTSDEEFEENETFSLVPTGDWSYGGDLNKRKMA